MARSWGAQFILLISKGLSSGSSGSFALSKDQSHLFILRLESYVAQAEEAINLYLIPQLINLNFANATSYPKFKFSQIDNDKFIEALTEVIKKVAVSDYLTKGANEKMARYLKVEIDPDEEIADASPVSPEDDSDDEADDSGSDQDNNSDENSEPQQMREGENDDNQVQWSRELTEAEKRIDMIDLQRLMRSSSKEFAEHVKTAHNALREQARTELRSSVRNSRAFNPKFTQNKITSLQDRILEGKITIYKRAEKQALREIKSEDNTETVSYTHLTLPTIYSV